MEVTGFLCPLMSGNIWYTPRCQLKQSCFAFKYILFHRQVSGKIVRVGHFLWVGDRGRALGVSSGGRSGRSSYSDRHSRTQSCLLWMVGGRMMQCGRVHSPYNALHKLQPETLGTEEITLAPCTSLTKERLCWSQRANSCSRWPPGRGTARPASDTRAQLAHQEDD